MRDDEREEARLLPRPASGAGGGVMDQSEAIRSAVAALVGFNVVDVERDIPRMLYYIRAKNRGGETFWQMETCAIRTLNGGEIEAVARAFANSVCSRETRPAPVGE